MVSTPGAITTVLFQGGTRPKYIEPFANCNNKENKPAILYNNIKMYFFIIVILISYFSQKYIKIGLQDFY